jgi:two-component system, cell cycle sensor histidine kinase and response regulator CckA
VITSATSERPPTAAALPIDQRYRELFEEALLGIYVSLPNGTLLACNLAFARMLGFDSVADAIGTAMSALYDDVSDRERFVASVRERGRLEHHRERLRRRDGSVVDVIETVVGEFDPAGALTELRGFLIDVTTTVEAELAMLERDRQFRSIFFDAADAMLILDDDRTILEANPAACLLFGVPADAVVAGSLDALVLDEDADELGAAWREVLALGEAQREHRVRALGGAMRVVECSYRARVHGHRHLCIARDITDRRLMEERLIQAEKIESVGRLAGGIAHDFNNLLTAILGYTELLLVARSYDDPDRRDLEEIQKAGQRAAALTQQLLAFSRKQVLVPKEVNLNHTIAGLKTMLCHLIREDITLVCDPAPAPAVVRIDPAQIEQAILNLVLNARDALPGGGVIRLEVARVPRSAIRVPVEQPLTADEYVQLRVVDNGVGMSADARAHLFEPFFTTKDVGKGTGLGLASVYGIVRQSNGLIAVDSEPGAGSVFTMYFPAVHARSASGTRSRVDTARNESARKAILLVEDEDAVRVIVSTVLRRQGYHVLEAATPTAAMAIFTQRQGDIDLLLTDVVMPEMSGPVLAQHLIGRRPELSVLFISGYADVALRPDSNRPNMSFLSKPFQASALTARVAQLLGAAPPEQMPSWRPPVERSSGEQN